VVDASAALEVLLQTRAAPRVSRRIFAAGETLRAPHLLDLEIAQVLRRYTRLGDISPQRGSEAIFTRSIRRPRRCSCSAALIPEYSFALDHHQSCPRPTILALTGLR